MPCSTRRPTANTPGAELTFSSVVDLYGPGRHLGLPFRAKSRRLPGQILRYLGLADLPVQQTPRHRNRKCPRNSSGTRLNNYSP